MCHKLTQDAIRKPNRCRNIWKFCRFDSHFDFLTNVFYIHISCTISTRLRPHVSINQKMIWLVFALNIEFSTRFQIKHALDLHFFTAILLTWFDCTHLNINHIRSRWNRSSASDCINSANIRHFDWAWDTHSFALYWLNVGQVLFLTFLRNA